MSLTTITARVIDQTIQVVTLPRIASGGVDELQIRFDFCSLWDGCGKTAVFYRDVSQVYHIPIVDSVAVVPHEVLTEAGHFYFGVMGAAENIRTTEVLKVKVVQGAITEATANTEEPTPGIYQQLMAVYGLAEQAIVDERVARAAADATEKEERKAEIAVERARINQLTALKDGSTTGDAELMDSRIAHNGREYVNAGEAVRGQINELRNGYSVFTSEDCVQGYMNRNGLQSVSIRIRLKNAVKVKKGDIISFEHEKTMRYCVWVLADDNITSPTVLSVTDQEIYKAPGTTYEIPEDGYLMINMQNAWNWGSSTAITPASFTGEIRLYSADRISELSDRVDGFTDAIHHLDCVVDGYTSADFESGSFESGGGRFDSPIRLRWKKAVKAKKGDVLSFENPDNLYFQAFLLADDNLDTPTVLNYWGWTRLNTFEATEDGYFYVMLANGATYSTSTAITPADFTGTIHHYRYDPRIENLQEKHNITYPVDTDKTKAFAALFNGKVNVEPFLFFTDPHLMQTVLSNAPGTRADWEKDFTEYMDCLRRYYNETPVDNIICGGDWYDADTQDVACWKMGRVYAQMRSITDNFHLVVGNHDTNEQGRLNADSEQQTGTLDDNTISNLWYRSYGQPYYTFETNNTRFFILNTGGEYRGQDAEQYEWFINELLQNTAENIVLFFHIVRGAGDGYVQQFANDITLYAKWFNERMTDIPSPLNNPSYTFGAAKGKVRFVMAGHRHTDSTEVLNTIPVVETTWMGDGGVPSFDLCLADYDNNKLHMIRVGTGENRTIDI